MTVNELIVELQVLSAQGHGELDVATYIPYDGGSDRWETDIVVFVNDNPLAITDSSLFVGIQDHSDYSYQHS